MTTLNKQLVSAALVALVGCSAPGSGDASSATTLSPPMPIGEGQTSTKNYHPELHESQNAAESAFKDDYDALLADREVGAWGTLASRTRSLAAKREAAGLPPDSLLHLYEAEAEIGLGRPTYALAALNDEQARLHDKAYTLTWHLALAQAGRLETAAALDDAREAVSHFAGADATALPTVKGTADAVTCVRLARAIDAWYTGRRQSAEREARAVLSKQPTQPAAALILSKELRLQKRFKEADSLLGIVRRMHGEDGREADRRVRLLSEVSASVAAKSARP